MFKKLKKVIVSTLVGLIALSPLALSASPAFASGRDCDDNAIIRCGSLSVSELKSDVDGSAQVKNIFATMGIHSSDFDGLQNGTVYKSGKVTVGGNTVATDVNSWGRHNISGSHRDTRFSFPIYYRHPSVSFNSSSLPAFVKLNSDGSFAFAVIKACGNPILKGLNADIKKPSPKFKVTINKFADDNMNKVKDANEKMLDDITFTISGKGIRTQWKKTNNAGQVVFDDIPKGTYKVEESYNPTWWKPTTSTNGIQNVTVNGNEVMWFGNKWQRHTVIVNKFSDANVNKIKDKGEIMLDDVTFTISGNGIKTAWKKTDKNGQVKFTNIPNGTYKVQESYNPKYWKPTTSTNGIQYVTVRDGNATEWFGNKWQQVVVQQTHNVIINKYNDLDRDARRDSNEPPLPGRMFRITGNGVDRVANTNSSGMITFGSLRNGTYTVTETLPTGWRGSTPTTQTVRVNNANATLTFGNYLVTRPPVNVIVTKYSDDNQNSQRESSEAFLSGWEFTLSGNGANRKLTTDSNGRLVFSNVANGTYTLVETTRAGWTPTSQNPLTIDVRDADYNVVFGNFKEGTPPPPETPETPETPGTPEQPEAAVLAAASEATTLPAAGVKETLLAFIALAFGYAIYTYRKSRRRLLDSMRS